LALADFKFALSLDPDSKTSRINYNRALKDNNYQEK
jgi:hypothetical protein